MPYIAFLDMVGTKSYASISNDEYANAINAFHKEMANVAKRFNNCQIYGYSDNAYIEVEKLDDMIQFMRRLRRRLMSKHFYFNAAVGRGSLCHVKVDMPQDKGFSMSFTSPSTVNVYMAQSKFTGIGVYLTQDVVDDLNSEQLHNEFCSSIYKPKYQDAFCSIYDISYDTIGLDELNYILSDYALATILDREAGRYYITPVISMIRNIDIDAFHEDVSKLTSIVMMNEIKSVLCADRIDEYSWLFLYTLIGRILSLDRNDSFQINIQKVFRDIVDSSKIDRKKLIENLPVAPLGVISNLEKKKLVQHMFAIYRS